MNPKIFDENATTFNSDGIGRLRDVVSCNVVEELNGKFELNMTMLSSDKYFDYIDIGKIIVAKPNLTDDEQAFVIESISKNIEGQIEIYATHIAQYRTKLIPIMKYSSTSLADSLQKIIENSVEPNPFTLLTNKSSTAKQSFEIPLTMRECLGGKEGSLIDVYGGEYKWNNFEISLLQRRGQDTNVRIIYGLNMTEFDVVDEFDFDVSITGIFPFWYDEEDGLVIGDVQYSPNANFRTYKKTIPVDFTNEFDSKPTLEQLNTIARSYIVSRGLPTRNISVSFEQIQQMFAGDNIKYVQNLSLGDTVNVINSEYGINYKSRIIQTDFDVILERYNSMEIGDKKTTINEAISSLVNVDIDDFKFVASDIKYSNIESGLTADNVQTAIDEIDGAIDDIGETLTLTNTSKNIAKNTSVVVGSLSLPKGKWIVNGSIFYPKASANNSTGWVYVGVGTGTGNNPQTNGTCNIDTYVGHIASKSVIYELTEESTTLNLVGWQNSGATMNNCVGYMKAIRIK